MQAASLFSINIFPHDDRLWRVDWMGVIQTNPAVLSEPTIRIFLTRLTKPFGKRVDAFDLGNLDKSHRQHADVGIGVLPLIWIGSVWRNGRRVDDNLRLEEFSFHVDTAEAEEITFSAGTTNYPFKRLIPAFEYPLGPIAWASTQYAPLVALNDLNNGNEILIPSIELIRFYYVSSSSTARGLFTDQYDTLIEKSEIQTGVVKPNVKLSLPSEVLRRDAWILARYVTSERMHDQVKKIRDWVVAKNAGGWEKKSVGINSTIFPFIGETRLKAQGINISGEDGVSRILATRLLNCAHPFPYGEVSVEVETGPKNDNGEPGGPRIIYLGWPTGVVPEQKEFRNDQEADKNMARTLLDASEVRFEDLKGRKLKVIKVSSNKNKGEGIVFKGGEEKGGLGTSEGTYGESDVAPTELSQNFAVAQSPENVTLQNFFQALDILRKKKGLQVKTIGIGKSNSMVDEEVVSSFEKQGNSNRQWSVLRYSDKLRGLIVAEIIHEGRYCYLFEIERDPNRVNDKYSVLAMATKSFSVIRNDELNLEATSCAMHGGWSKSGASRQYYRRFVPHRSEGTENTSDIKFSERIYAAIHRLGMFS